MRGYYEEDPSVTARRNLESAARRYAGAYLRDMIGIEVDSASTDLANAASAYAETFRPTPKPKRKTTRAAPNKGDPT